MKTLTEKTLIWAHRGASGYRPENTLESFALAAEMKADGVELDVQLTKDGQIVVLHDSKIDRTSNGQGAVSEYTFDELRRFDFGYKFYGECRGVDIPTLAQVYELLSPTGLTVNVEIKADDPAMMTACGQLINLAKQYGMEKKVIYSSFDHLQLLKMKEADPAVVIAPLYGFNLVNPWNYALDMEAGAVHPRLTLLDKFDGYVERCHEVGVRVHSWTANSSEDIKYLISLGCDAVITNYPDVAYAQRENK